MNLDAPRSDGVQRRARWQHKKGMAGDPRSADEVAGEQLECDVAANLWHDHGVADNDSKPTEQ